MNITLRPYQRECIAAIEAQAPGRYLVQMATGLGKCFERGTKILMHDGTVKCVEEIEEGELVMGPDSCPREVCGLSRGCEQMYRVTPVKGEPYTVNESHILSLMITGLPDGKTVTDSRGRKFKGHEICNISIRDYLASSKTFRHCAKGWRVGVDFERRTVDIPPYILGIWLGDGTSAGTEITTMDADVVRALHRYAFENGMKVCVRDSGKTGKAITYSLTGKSAKHGQNQFRVALKKYGLLKNKHIPFDYLVNDKENRLELLAGLLDSDGFLVDDGCCFEIVTKYPDMRNGILYLARSLGFSAYCTEKTVNSVAYYRIIISGDTSKILCKVERRKAKPRGQKKNALVTGITVKPVGVGEYFGFELRGPDRLFLLADFTVVHNTATFANIPRRGKLLILSHREELVRQPLKYFDCPTGVEMAKEHAPPTAEVVSASVMSIVRRLERFGKEEFDLIVCDECHHAASRTYRKIFGYFQPRKLIGFTATPNRSDHARLDDVFQDIIFQRDLQWGIREGWLCDIYCRRVNIGYDLSAVHTRNGDYAPGELEEAMDGTADAVAEAYRKLARGATLIFAVSVRQCQEIAARIPGAVAVTGETKDRASIIERFTRREIPCIVNCMVFTEGTDMPLVETVMIARPTQSDSLYAQLVGRGLRPHPEKKRLNLIDCVGVTGKASLCTAPSLLGINMDLVPKAKQEQVEGLLFELPEKVSTATDSPESWIRNIEIVDLWAKGKKYNTHNVNWFQMPDGALICSLTKHPDTGRKRRLYIPPPDQLGRVTLGGELVEMQTALDRAYRVLQTQYSDCAYLWDLAQVKRWGAKPATEKQLVQVQRMLPGFDTSELTKAQASQILNRMFNRK